MGLFFDSIFVEVLCAIVLGYWMLYLYFAKDYGYWERKNITHIPAVFPFGSDFKVMLGWTFLGISLDRMYREHGDQRFVGFTIVRKPWLMIRDPDFCRSVLQKDFPHFMDRSGAYTHPKDYMMNHLFMLKGQEWKDTRMKLTPAYTAVKLKAMFFLVKSCSKNLHDVIDQSAKSNVAVDVKDVMSRYATDVVATCAFGLKIDSLSNKESRFYKAGRKANEVGVLVLLKVYLIHAFPIFSKLHCFDFMDSKIKNFITGVVRKTIEYREKYNVSSLDFLDMLIKLRQNGNILDEGEPSSKQRNVNQKSQGMTIEEITAETFMFFKTGYETTSNTIMFCLYELACNSRIQDTLFSEVEEVLDRHASEISYQALQEMTYMDQVINEALRCYPVFPHLSRVCTQDYRVPDSTLEIDKGVSVVIPVYSLHHDPKYFPDPYTFDPDRFSPENCKGRHPYVYLPFGEGPRMCIGLRFGLMKIKTALATLVSDYQISLTPETEVPLQFKSNSFTTLPSTTLKLIFSKRKQKV
ncbi:probable cytochrome P450 6a14 [Homalodisca vitripennis]|uniref:probable cytochrome P450 6a14 n=1 Tax=Homalodisca vitripennis TaxID=197043 RepID=UPI001EE9E936|nr:probable cytochrome P450 6a14 [Homalodisca vitripennis]